MAIHLESIFLSTESNKSEFVVNLLSNPLYAAGMIVVIFILILFLFFPLKKDTCSQYFKLLVYVGIVSAIILSVHSDIIIKNVEMKFQQHSSAPIENGISIEPRKGGHLAEFAQIPEARDEELETIMKNLEDNVI